MAPDYLDRYLKLEVVGSFDCKRGLVGRFVVELYMEVACFEMEVVFENR